LLACNDAPSIVAEHADAVAAESTAVVVVVTAGVCWGVDLGGSCDGGWLEVAELDPCSFIDTYIHTLAVEYPACIFGMVTAAIVPGRLGAWLDQSLWASDSRYDIEGTSS